MPESFGALLRNHRLAAGMSQGELARRINYSKSQVSKIENGYQLPSRIFAQLCDEVLGTGGVLNAATTALRQPDSAAEPESTDHSEPQVDAEAPPPPRLRIVPLGPPLQGSGELLTWGTWGQVDGRPVLATGGDSGTVGLWHPRGLDYHYAPLAGHLDKVEFGAWGHIDDQPVLATGGSTVRLWDPREHEQLGEPFGGSGRVLCGAWGRIGHQAVLATGDEHGWIWLWDPRDRILLGEPFRGTAARTCWLAWGRVDDRSLFATGHEDGTVQLWDPQTDIGLGAALTGHNGSVMWGAWGRIDNQPVLATGSLDGTVRLWDPRTCTALGEPLTGHADAWGVWGQIDDQPVLAAGGDEGTVLLWDPRTRASREVPFVGDPVSWGAWAQIDDRPVLATGGMDAMALLWDPQVHTSREAKLDRIYLGFPNRWGAWGAVDNRPVLATGGTDGFVQLWEVVEDRPVDRWSTYQSDVSASADELARQGDAVALAELVTAKSARPPLAVGLFGDWGEGKSHFLGLLRDQVRVAARPDNPLTHDAVRQVWFNAWHYAETDLWASLVAELFAQLARPAGDQVSMGAEQRSQSRLAAELVAERGLRERLAAARARHEDLTEALRRVDPDRSWDALSAEQKQQLGDLGAPDPEQLYRTVVRTGAALRETGRGWWRLVRGLRPRNIALASGWLLVLVAATGAIAWGVPWLARWVATLPATLTVLTLAAFVARLVREARTRAGRAWQAAVRLAESQQLRLRTAAEVAAAEVTELEREVQDLTAAGQLAGLVTERAASGSYRGRLGVMTQIRDDFQRMAELLAHADRDADGLDEAGDPLPRISRIVLYVDDLDRCPPHRVVEMLEAIHLLLAVELFVVVVAVDPRWLLRSIAAHYPDLVHAADPATAPDHEMVDPDDEELWRSNPAQYLEKIFQVVLTLPPLDTLGYQRMLRTLVGTREDVPPPAPTAPSGAGVTTPVTSQIVTHTPLIPSDTVEDDTFGARLPAARVVERVDPLTLEPDELTLLDLLGPPLLVTTPRGVKRLANSYGLLTAIRRDHRAGDLAERDGVVLGQSGEERAVHYHPYRAGLVLLGILVAYPAFGPAILLHLYHADDRTTWGDYLDDLTPVKGEAGWANEAAPTMTPVRAAQWHALVTALRQVTAGADDHDLALPEPLSAWKEWIVPVGRLSFPAGRIVNTLDRQPPLPRPHTGRP